MKVINIIKGIAHNIEVRNLLLCKKFSWCPLTRVFWLLQVNKVPFIYEHIFESICMDILQDITAFSRNQ